METKANYVLIGLFTLAAVLGAFGFVYWFNNVGSLGDRVAYRVVFETPVTGLRTGGSVLFNGIRIGEVTSLGLDPASPRRVVATISVDKRAAVRADTRVGLDYQGLTGNAAIALRGGSDAAPAPADGMLKADTSSSADVTQAAREVLRKLDGLISDNNQALNNSLKNIETVTRALADNDQALRKSLKNIETVTQALADNDGTLRTSLKNIETVSQAFADNDGAMRSSLKNIETFTQTLADNSGRIDRIIAGAETLIGSEDRPGEFAEAARAIRTAADNLDRRSGEIAAGLERFSSVGLKEWERLAVDGRRTMNTLERTIKNIDQNPSRLLFGGAPEAKASAKR
jgi:phospholipid/cholesterol/gamma-HCH transport system substrate-binding protein